jgi:hypothetical protein
VDDNQDDVKRHAAMLLNLAKRTTSPDLAAVMVTKAADLKSQIDESGLTDHASLVPDVEPPPSG